MIDFPPELAEHAQAFAAENIPDEALYLDPADPTNYGRETHTHTTVAYGLDPAMDRQRIADVVAGIGKPVRVKLGKISKFEPAKYDVIKVEVDSPDLHALHEVVKALGVPGETYPEYKPHLTLAYVQKGAADHLLGQTPFEGQEFELTSFDYSAPPEPGAPDKHTKYQVKAGLAGSVKAKAWLLSPNGVFHAWPMDYEKDEGKHHGEFLTTPAAKRIWGKEVADVLREVDVKEDMPSDIAGVALRKGWDRGALSADGTVYVDAGSKRSPAAVLALLPSEFLIGNSVTNGVDEVPILEGEDAQTAWAHRKDVRHRVKAASEDRGFWISPKGKFEGFDRNDYSHAQIYGDLSGESIADLENEGVDVEEHAIKGGWVRGLLENGVLYLRLKSMAKIAEALEHVPTEMRFAKAIVAEAGSSSLEVPVLGDEDALDAWAHRKDVRHRVKATTTDAEGSIQEVGKFWLDPAGKRYDLGPDTEHADHLDLPGMDVTFEPGDFKAAVDQLLDAGWTRGGFSTTETLYLQTNKPVEWVLARIPTAMLFCQYLEVEHGGKTDSVRVQQDEGADDAWAHRNDARHRVAAAGGYVTSKFWLSPEGEFTTWGERDRRAGGDGWVEEHDQHFPGGKIKNYMEPQAKGWTSGGHGPGFMYIRLGDGKTTDWVLSKLPYEYLLVPLAQIADSSGRQSIEVWVKEGEDLAQAWARRNDVRHRVAASDAYSVVGYHGTSLVDPKNLFDEIGGNGESGWITVNEKSAQFYTTWKPGQGGPEEYKVVLKGQLKLNAPMVIDTFEDWVEYGGEQQSLASFMAEIFPDEGLDPELEGPYEGPSVLDSQADISAFADQAGCDGVVYTRGFADVSGSDGADIEIFSPSAFKVTGVKVLLNGTPEAGEWSEYMSPAEAEKFMAGLEVHGAGKWRDAYWVRPDGSLLEVKRTHAETIIEVPEYKAVAEAERGSNYDHPLVAYGVTSYKRAIAEGWARVSARRGFLYIEAADDVAVRRAIKSFPGTGITELTVDMGGESFEVPVLEGEDVEDAWAHRKDVRHRVAAGISPVVYHATSLQAAASILQSDEFKLSVAQGSDAKNLGVPMPVGKFYYLSTARSRTGGYAKDPYRQAATIEIDGTALANRYSGDAVDYWGPEFRGVDPNKFEKEDRVWAKEATIPDASRYIKAVLAFYDPKVVEDMDKRAVRALAIAAKTKGVPFRLYTDKASYVADNKAKAVPVTDLDLKTPPAESHRSYGPLTEGRLEGLVELFKAPVGSKLTPKADDVRNAIVYSDYNVETFIARAEIDLQNSRKNGKAASLVQSMREAKVRDLRQFVYKVAEKWKVPEALAAGLGFKSNFGTPGFWLEPNGDEHDALPEHSLWIEKNPEVWKRYDEGGEIAAQVFNNANDLNWWLEKVGWVRFNNDSMEGFRSSLPMMKKMVKKYYLPQDREKEIYVMFSDSPVLEWSGPAKKFMSLEASLTRHQAEEAVALAIGEASVSAWETVGEGVFQSEKMEDIVRRTVDKLEHWGAFEAYALDHFGIPFRAHRIFAGADLVFMDRYQALGIPYPDPKTCCKGRCEGTGFIPVKFTEPGPGQTYIVYSDEDEATLRPLWDAAEALEHAEDGWHFVKCPDCGGTGRIAAGAGAFDYKDDYDDGLKFWFTPQGKLIPVEEGEGTHVQYLIDMLIEEGLFDKVMADAGVPAEDLQAYHDGEDEFPGEIWDAAFDWAADNGWNRVWNVSHELAIESSDEATVTKVLKAIAADDSSLLFVETLVAGDEIIPVDEGEDAQTAWDHRHSPRKRVAAAAFSREELESKGYRFENKEPYQNGKGLIVVWKDGGLYVGDLRYRDVEESDHSIEPKSTSVEEAHRRLGIATAMYDMAEQVSGKVMSPSAVQSDDAEALWRDRKFKKWGIRTLAKRVMASSPNIKFWIDPAGVFHGFGGGPGVSYTKIAHLDWLEENGIQYVETEDSFFGDLPTKGWVRGYVDGGHMALTLDPAAISVETAISRIPMEYRFVKSVSVENPLDENGISEEIGGVWVLDGEDALDAWTHRNDARHRVDGAALNPALDDPEFKEWFAGSHVVDKSGNPLLVFHGTDVVNIDKFYGDTGDVVPGLMYFSDKVGVAKSYGAVIYGVYLKMKNPLVEDAAGGKYGDVMPRNYAIEAMDNGYDGVILKNVKDDVHGLKKGTNYMVWNADQVWKVSEKQHGPNKHIRPSLSLEERRKLQEEQLDEDEKASETALREHDAWAKSPASKKWHEDRARVEKERKAKDASKAEVAGVLVARKTGIRFWITPDGELETWESDTFDDPWDETGETTHGAMLYSVFPDFEFDHEEEIARNEDIDVAHIAIKHGYTRGIFSNNELDLELGRGKSVEWALGLLPAEYLFVKSLNVEGKDEIPVLEGEDAMSAWSHRKDARHRVAAANQFDRLYRAANEVAQDDAKYSGALEDPALAQEQGQFQQVVKDARSEADLERAWAQFQPSITWEALMALAGGQS